MRIATPAFFCLPCAWNIFCHFQSICDFRSEVGSYRQYIYESCFCIRSARLCLLVEAFNPFTFKVLFDIYVPFAIFLIDLGGFWIFPSLVFLDYTSPFSFCCQAGLVVLNSLHYCLSEKLLISPSILNEILARYSKFGC